MEEATYPHGRTPVEKSITTLGRRRSVQKVSEILVGREAAKGSGDNVAIWALTTDEDDQEEKGADVKEENESQVTKIGSLDPNPKFPSSCHATVAPTTAPGSATDRKNQNAFDAESRHRRERRLARNRQTARERRKRKLLLILQLENKVQLLTTQNDDLRQRNKRLKGHLSRFGDLFHDPSSTEQIETSNSPSSSFASQPHNVSPTTLLLRQMLQQHQLNCQRRQRELLRVLEESKKQQHGLVAGLLQAQLGISRLPLHIRK